MRSTGALCADKAAAHQELLLGSSRKAEAGRRGQPHVTISKKNFSRQPEQGNHTQAWDMFPGVPQEPSELGEPTPDGKQNCYSKVAGLIQTLRA